MSAPDASTPPPTPPPAAPAREVPRPRGRPWWLREAGALALSLLLAVLLWSLMRDRITVDDTTSFTVVPIHPPGARAFVFTYEVTLPLRGPRSEVEAAKQQVNELRGAVPLRVGELGDGDVRPLRNGVDTYALPFPERLLPDPLRPPLPSGEVVRLETRNGVRVLAPRLDNLPEGLLAEVELSRPLLSVVAPVGALDGELQPDPVDVARLLAAQGGSLTAPLRVRLTFDGWRGTLDGSALAAITRRRREAVLLDDLEAVVRLRLREQRLVTNTVETWVKRGARVIDLNPGDATGFTGRLEEGSEGAPVEGTYAGMVRGTAEALESLERHPDRWRWVLSVRDEDLPGPDEDGATVTGRLQLVVFDADLRRDLARGTLQADDLPLQVVVRTQPSR